MRYVHGNSARKVECHASCNLFRRNVVEKPEPPPPRMCSSPFVAFPPNRGILIMTLLRLSPVRLRPLGLALAALMLPAAFLIAPYVRAKAEKPVVPAARRQAGSGLTAPF